MLRISTLLLLCIFGMSTFAVSVTEDRGKITVKNSEYTVVYSKNTAYAGLFTGKKGSAMAMPYLYLDTELEKYNERKNPKPVMVNRRQLKFNSRIKENSTNKVVLEISANFNGGKMTETVTFDNSPVIKYDVTVEHNVRLHLHSLKLLADGIGPKAVFRPDDKRVAGYPVYGNVISGQAWRGMYEPSWSHYFILGAVNHPNFAGIEYGMTGKKEQKNIEHAEISATSIPLAQKGKKGVQKFAYTVIVSPSVEKAENAAAKIFGRKNTPYFFSYDTEKLIVRPGKENALLCNITNHGQANEILLRTSLIYNLAVEKVINEQKLNLKQNSKQQLRIPVKFPSDAKFGVILKTDMFDRNGKLLDSAQEYCCITDFAPRDASFGITNASLLYTKGMAEVQNSGFKKRYVGAYEYYCWAKSVIGALAPEDDSWIPNTEHSVDSTLTKDMVKFLVKDAHSKGVGVYSWITGLWNYQYAFRYPERLQYNKDGQPNIYSGKVYPDGRRRAVVKPHMFTPERAAEWGREMADSIDMFGWDGCRWDWSFCPNMLSDPLFMGEHAEDWYDYKGVPSSKLFPDPDQTAVDCLKAWRKAVAERHPDFIYGTNYGSRPVLMKMNPKYKIESARNALTLFEDMAAFNRKEWATFELWGDELTRRIDVIRPHGAAPTVGFMIGLPPNSVSHNLARYTLMASGAKWWDSNIISIDTPADQVRNRFQMRYAKYLFGNEFLRPAKLSVTLPKEKNILCKTFIRERKVKNGREIIIPMINMPEDNWYICQYHDAPVVKKNIKMTILPRKGEKIDKIYLMTPHQPEKAIELKSANGTFTVPELIDFCFVLVQLKGE